MSKRGLATSTSPPDLTTPLPEYRGYSVYQNFSKGYILSMQLREYVDIILNYYYLLQFYIENRVSYFFT